MTTTLTCGEPHWHMNQYATEYKTTFCGAARADVYNIAGLSASRVTTNVNGNDMHIISGLAKPSDSSSAITKSKIDGVALQAGDRILIQNQIYGSLITSASSPWKNDTEALVERIEALETLVSRLVAATIPSESAANEPAYQNPLMAYDRAMKGVK